MFRPAIECFKESEEVTPQEKLWYDLLKERTDLDVTRLNYQVAFYEILEDEYPHLRGTAENGEIGYRLTFVEQSAEEAA